MVSRMDELKEKWKAEGIAEGKAEGIAEGIAEGTAETKENNIKAIMKNLGVDRAKAEEILAY